ncbi:hypothetical protein R6Q59_026414 [Mikania micrantha]
MRNMAARVKSIFIYPIKSCRGISVSKAAVSVTGFVWDRHWLVINSKGRACTQRAQPNLALVQVDLPSEAFSLGWEPNSSSYLGRGGQTGFFSRTGTGSKPVPEADRFLQTGSTQDPNRFRTRFHSKNTLFGVPG